MTRFSPLSRELVLDVDVGEVEVGRRRLETVLAQDLLHRRQADPLLQGRRGERVPQLSPEKTTGITIPGHFRGERPVCVIRCGRRTMSKIRHVRGKIGSWTERSPRAAILTITLNATLY